MCNCVSVFFNVCMFSSTEASDEKIDNKQICDTQRQAWHFDKKAKVTAIQVHC